MNKAERRAAIIETARSRFRRYGIHKTTMQEIAEDAGLAVGTLYLYFKNKDDLVLGCAERLADREKSFVEELLVSNLKPEEKLRRYVINRYRAAEEKRVGSSHVAEIARAVMRLNPQRFREDDEWLYNNILSILKDGIKNGSFTISSPEKDAEIFVQAILYFLPVAGMEPHRPPTEAKLMAMIEWFIKLWKS